MEETHIKSIKHKYFHYHAGHVAWLHPPPHVHTPAGCKVAAVVRFKWGSAPQLWKWAINHCLNNLAISYAFELFRTLTCNTQYNSVVYSSIVGQINSHSNNSELHQFVSDRKLQISKNSRVCLLLRFPVRCQEAYSWWYIHSIKISV